MMTDKDIKDYCKNCDVEPPAMRLKCPECEHNSDKEIFAKDIYVPRKEQIIIDGADVSGCLFYQSNFEEDYDVKIKHFCSNWHNSCESINNSDCYYKQLARKTQELYFARNEIHSKTEYIREQRDIIDKLKQECEELKEQLMETKTFDLFADKLIEKFNTDSAIASIFKNNTRYRKALDEIEKILKDEICEECPGKEGCKAGCKEHQCLDIINKAKGKE